MTLKHGHNMVHYHGDNSNETDSNEKYRIMSESLEKKIRQIAKSNEKIAAR